MSWLLILLFYFIFWVSTVTLTKTYLKKLPVARAAALSFFCCLLIVATYNLIFGEFRFETTFLFIILVGFFNGLGAYFFRQAYKHSLSKTVLFLPLSGVITVALAAIFLGENRIYNAGTILGVFLLFSAAFSLSRRSPEKRESTEAKWLLFTLGMVVIVGVALFVMKFFSFTLPRSTFLLYWYSGSFLGLLSISWFERKDPRTLFQRITWRVILSSFGIVASLTMVYWAFQLAPTGLVEPIRYFGITFLPLPVGWYIFKEKKTLTNLQKFGFILGIIGAALIILSTY